MTRDLICAATLLTISASYYALANNINRSALADAIGPAGLPTVYAIILAVLAIGIAAQAVIGRMFSGQPKTSTSSHDVSPRVVLLRASGVLAIGIGYLFIVPLIGYFPSLIVVIAGMASYHGETSIGRISIIAVAGAASFWVIFVWLLGIPMPSPWDV
jgi:putative tricarboxylic transport membrane protein